MKKQYFFITLICFLLFLKGNGIRPVHAAGLASSQVVEVTAANGRVVTAHLALPDTKGPVASVVVIHENRGLTGWVKSVADRLAVNGFAAIAPDLLSGAGPDGGGTDSFPSSGDATRALSALNSDQITADLKAVAQYVRNLPETTDKIAVAGYCWGGMQTFRFATNEASLAAVFVFYGDGPSAADILRITAPVYGFYAENDNRINSTIPATQEAMAAAGRTYEFEIYPGVGHAFLRSVEESANPSEVEKAAFNGAWERFLNLLGELQTTPTPVDPQGKLPTTLGERKTKD